jgi:uncharacterized membrane protein
MAKAKPAPKPQRVHAFIAHWKLIVAAGLGAAVGLACAAFLDLRPATDAILAWDTTCAIYIALLLWRLRGHSVADIRKHAGREDQGRAVVLLLVLVSAGASLMAVGAELGYVQDAKGVELTANVALVVATVALSFFMMHMIFAVRYAHEYYDPAERSGGGDSEGLLFPGGAAPDYWDFLHFAIIIGVACQTADIQITDKELRRLSTLHSLTAFAFNTVIVALTINLLASVFG